MTTEFKDVLDKQPVTSDCYHAHGRWAFENRERIRRALLIADRLMQDPSDGMYRKADEAFWHRKHSGRNVCYESIYKAMRDQLIKEATE